VTNGVSSNEHASHQQRLATSWEYRRDSVSCSVTFAQHTSLLEFAVPSLEFHCVLWFFNVLLNKTPRNQRRINKQSSGVQEQINPFYIFSYGKNSFCLRTFQVTNGLQEWIKFVNRGSSVFQIALLNLLTRCIGLHIRSFELPGLYFQLHPAISMLLSRAVFEHKATNLVNTLTITLLGLLNTNTKSLTHSELKFQYAGLARGLYKETKETQRNKNESKPG
jgi:hypothetical protein